MRVGEIITVAGRRYFVEEVRTIEDMRSTHPHTARALCAAGITARGIGRLVNGKKLYFIDWHSNDDVTLWKS
jgi:hypothetical protein